MADQFSKENGSPVFSKTASEENSSEMDLLNNLERSITNFETSLMQMRIDLSMLRTRELLNQLNQVDQKAEKTETSSQTVSAPQAETQSESAVRVESIASPFAQAADVIPGTSPESMSGTPSMSDLGVEKVSGEAESFQEHTTLFPASEQATVSQQPETASAFGRTGSEPQSSFSAESDSAAEDGGFPGQETWHEEKPRPEDSFWSRLQEKISTVNWQQYISLSNLWGLVGMVFMLIAVVFIIRYAEQLGMLTPIRRLVASCLFGIALLAFGWLKRSVRRGLALIFQGGGIAVLYLAIVAGVKLYGVIPNEVAFFILVLIVLCSTILAVFQNALAMAHIAYIAGFLAPILVSRSEGNYIALFSYYILLNLGIVLISRFRVWRSLYLTGFLLTVWIGCQWGATKYVPEFFWPVQFFLWAFFALFTYFALCSNQPLVFDRTRKTSIFIDVPITFGVPAIMLILQMGAMEGRPYYLAVTSLILGFIYLILATRLRALSEKRQSMQVQDGVAGDFSQSYLKGMTLEVQIYLLFGMLFANLTLPLLLGEFTTIMAWKPLMLSVVWASQGAMLLWLGRKNDLLMFLYLGLAGLILGVYFMFLHAAKTSYFYYELSGFWFYTVSSSMDGLPMLAASMTEHIITCVLYLSVAGAVFFSGVVYRQYGVPQRGRLVRIPALAFIWGGQGLAFFALFMEFLNVYYAQEVIWVGVVGLVLLSLYFSRKLAWIEVGHVFIVSAFVAGAFALSLCTAYLATCFFDSSMIVYPKAMWRSVLLFAGAVSLLYAGYLWNRPWPKLWRWSFLAYAAALPFFATCAVFSGWGLFLQSQEWGESLLQSSGLSIWLRGVLAIIPGIWLVLFIQQSAFSNRFSQAIRFLESSVAAILLILWFIHDLFTLGDPSPFWFIPVLNPLNLLLCAAVWLFFSTSKWMQLRRCLPEQVQKYSTWVVWIFVLFIVANMEVIRSCSMLLHVPFSLPGVLGSASCQALLAILWVIFGFGLMVQGHRKTDRFMWLLGGGIIIADVVKLIFFDLMYLETVWRILAFLIAGIVLMAIGWFMPKPPEEQAIQK